MQEKTKMQHLYTVSPSDRKTDKIVKATSKAEALKTALGKRFCSIVVERGGFYSVKVSGDKVINVMVFREGE